ncbi:MAG: response regulator transcription factor [Brevundimonas sp.]|uniref:response regulator transcription factor n=1 Tax=Brevundimonas sp. TaxID=1871086 RepID=UPI0028D90746|nr:response regulator [uncultured Brevundimonas sp.]
MTGSVATKDKPPRADADPVFASNTQEEAASEIVVIDDDAMILQMTLLTFREAGYQAVGFSDPLDALMWASDADPTLVVVDLKLPGIEGLDLVSAFCAFGRHAVILVSAYVDVLTTVDAMRLGVDNVLTKPTSPERLLSAARHALDALARTPHQDTLTFTRRETQVAEFIVAGRTTKQIAQALSLSPRTVEFFRASLLRKTQSPNSAALASALTRLGFAASEG